MTWKVSKVRSSSFARIEFKSAFQSTWPFIEFMKSMKSFFTARFVGYAPVPTGKECCMTKKYFDQSVARGAFKADSVIRDSDRRSSLGHSLR